MADIRTNRLRGDARLLAELNDSSTLIDIQTLHGDPPDHYRVIYNVRGVEKLVNGQPYHRDQHIMEVYLPAQYPKVSPQFVWKTPIFHPNIHPFDGRVCIDRWFAATNLADIVVMIGDIVRYKNFNPDSPLNKSAAIWARENTRLFPLDSRSWRRGERTAETRSSTPIIEIGSPVHSPSAPTSPASSRPQPEEIVITI